MELGESSKESCDYSRKWYGGFRYGRDLGFGLEDDGLRKCRKPCDVYFSREGLRWREKGRDLL
jgi:hypothetical protein